jgi:hypothetical protein
MAVFKTIIQLTAAGADTGPLFNLYYDLDNFTTPFASNVSKATLLMGMSASFPFVNPVPEIIQIQSTGTCTNSIYINISGDIPY